MEIPIRFPHPADVIAEEAERERQLTVEQRLDKIADLFAFGNDLASVRRAGNNRRQAKARFEAEWQRCHREVFEKHGR